MLYLLLVPLAKDHIAFNVFRYITFRAAMATVSALLISFVLGPWLIRKLRQAQHGGDKSVGIARSDRAALQFIPVDAGAGLFKQQPTFLAVPHQPLPGILAAEADHPAAIGSGSGDVVLYLAAGGTAGCGDGGREFLALRGMFDGGQRRGAAANPHDFVFCHDLQSSGKNSGRSGRWVDVTRHGLQAEAVGQTPLICYSRRRVAQL